MKITKLIEIFEKLLPVFEKFLKNKSWEQQPIFICRIAYRITNTGIHHLFCDSPYNKGYYAEYIIDLPKYHNIIADPSSKEGLEYRIWFLESQIKELSQLLKEGYTDV